MAEPHTMLVICICIAVYVLFVRFLTKRSNEEPKGVYHPEKPSTSRDALHETLHALTSTSLAARASKAGSATLRNLWRLNNPFVSDSTQLQQAYRHALMKHFTHTDSEAWTAISNTVAKAIQPLLRHVEGEDKAPRLLLNIRDASRDATLAAVLQGLFGIDDVAPERLRYIGNEIHRLTVGKKQFDAIGTIPGSLPQELQRDADRMCDTLRALFVDAASSSELAANLLCTVSGTSDDFNPLNLVIPAFEAPWRATFYTLLAILQPGPSHPSSVLTLLTSPPHLHPPPSTLAIIYESLRLYPPIRRVRRDQRIDIEVVQRNPAYWGHAAETFDPARFLDEGGDIRSALIAPGSAWMPFAVGTMRCPSASGYSARLIAAIVGSVLRQLFLDGEAPRWVLEGAEWDEGARMGRPLRAGREEYGGVRVVVGGAQGAA